MDPGDVQAAIRTTRGHKPDVLVLDLNMPGGSSLEAIPVILEQAPSTAIVVLTMQNDPSFARQALHAERRPHRAAARFLRAPRRRVQLYRDKNIATVRIARRRRRRDRAV